MKKQNDSRIAIIFKSVFNVRAWLDFDRMKAYTLYLIGAAKRLVIFDKDEKKEKEKNFSETVDTMKLSKKDLEDRQSALYRLSIIMCIFALGIFGYGIYQIIYGTLKAFILSLVIGLIALVMSFRYHFWYFQIRSRKLGCTFKEWYRKGFLGEK